MDTTLAALDAAMASGEPLVAAGAGLDAEPFQAQLPDAPAAPAAGSAPGADPAPAAPAAAAPVSGDDEPPAPVLHPSAKTALPEGMTRNFRLAAQDEAEALAFQIRKSNPNMHMRDALSQAEKQLGLAPAPAAAPAPGPAPTPPADPVADIDTQIAELRSQRKNLNAVMDAPEYNDITAQIEDLVGQRGELKAQRQLHETLQHQQEVAQELTAAEQQFAEVAAVFEDLNDDSSEFARTFAAAHNANIQQDSPLLQDPNYERLLAYQVAGSLMMQGKTFKVKGAATPPAQAPTNPTGTTPAAPAPAPTASTAPAPAGMAPLTGTPPTSEHRVIVQSADPVVAAQQQIQSAARAGDNDAVLAALNLSLGGVMPQSGLAFHSID